jgi:hypothetical protein
VAFGEVLVTHQVVGELAAGGSCGPGRCGPLVSTAAMVVSRSVVSTGALPKSINAKSLPFLLGS